MQDQDFLLLLNLSQLVATVRSEADLAALLQQQLRPVFNFEKVILLVSLAGKAPRYLAGGPSTQPTAAQDLPAEAWRQFFPARKMLLADLSALFPLTQPPQQPPHENAGEVLSATLRLGGLCLGFVGFQYPSAGADTQQLPLFQQVVDLLAGAVANLLVHEQAEHLQDRLLDPPVGVPARKYAAQEVAQACHQLLAFEASCLVAYDENLGYQWFSLGDLPPAIAQDEAVRGYYPQLRPRRDLQADASRQAWLAEPAISYLDRPPLEQIRNRGGYPILGAALREGLQESVYIHLRLGPQPVGALYLYSFQAGQLAAQAALFPYLERLLESVAFSVNNALVHEALQAAEQEKTLQLAVGQTLLGSHDWTALFAALAREMGVMVAWDFFAAARLSDFRTVLCLRKDPAGNLLPAEDLEALRDAASLDEVSFQEALQALRPLYAEAGVYGGEAYRSLCTHYRLLEVVRRLYGLQSLLILPVALGGDDAVVLTLGSCQPFLLSEATLALLRRLSPQLSLALQNQVAFTEIVDLKRQLEQEKTYLVEEINTGHNVAEIVGSSVALGAVFRRVDQVAPTDTTVLILGETGTGKELVARALHQRSPRREQLLVKVNCASLPAQLIESELFGHEKGAFTGATERRIGKFELAHKGTIFLDEIGELPLELQAKLLRVLQEREIERLGGSKVIAVDVRVLAATNRVLADEVATGRFRADLYYRLNVFPLALPPLRQRPEDIAPLADYFGRRFSRRMGRPFRGLQAGCLAQLLRYPWPGNVRELENVIEHAVIVSNGQLLECEVPAVPSDTPATAVPLALPISPIRADRDQWERERLEAVLQKTHWRIRGVGGAAALLNMKPTTLEARLKRLGLR